MAESTSTKILDDLIAAQPHRVELYRTRGIVHCFRDEYQEAIKDFTHALKESRSARKARLAHANGTTADARLTKSGKRKKGVQKKTNGQAPPDGTSAAPDGDEPDNPPSMLLHPSCLPDAADPIEHQLLFHRGAAYLHQAMYMIERAALQLEEVEKHSPTFDGIDLRLSYLDRGKYGGTEIGNGAGPLGSYSGRKFKAYRQVFNEPSMREGLTTLFRKSIRDHEKFISHFDTLESPGAIPDVDLAQQIEYSFLLSESHRPGHHHPNGPAPRPEGTPDVPPMFTTYHPLLVESHFSVLICRLLLADFASLLPNFVRIASLVDGLEGYPVFLPPRSMSQAEFVEVLERLAGGWDTGIQPHSLSQESFKGKLIKSAPSIPSLPPSPPDSPVTSSPPSQHINGSSSSSANYGQAGSSSSSSHLMEEAPPAQPPQPSFSSSRPDAEQALDYARILLAPVYKRQKERAAEKAHEKALQKANKKKPSPPPISIPLHGPRVDLMLAWMASVHLPDLDSVEGGFA